METGFTICRDVDRTEEAVVIIGESGQRMIEYTALLYKGLPDVVKQSKGTHMLHIDDMESIVLNPTDHLNHLTLTRDYGWFAKDCIMKANRVVMFTDWSPYFHYDPSIPIRMEGTNGIVVTPSLRSATYFRKSVPLLETLIHIEQAWSGMTLCQIASCIRGSFDPMFNDMSKLMSFLFERYRKEMELLCKCEHVPLHNLHQSDFNLYFIHNKQRSPYMNNIRVSKRLKDVIMVPFSRLLRKETYGNIPWIMLNGQEKEQLLRRAKHAIHPLGFFENAGQYSELDRSVHFVDVCILTSVTITGRVYAAGSIMGIVDFGNGSRDTLFLGELFEDLSTREQLILTFMYDAFLRGEQLVSMSCSNILRFLKLEEEQLKVREPLISAVRDLLLGVP